MIRLDKFLCTMEAGSRSQVKEFIKKGQVTVNGQVCRQPDAKIREECDRVVCQGRELFYEPFVYYMLNKPAGVVSATKDKREKTVLDLLEAVPGKGIFPVGRLDKDTEGLLLLTNDGRLSHELLSPVKHVPKTYQVETALPITQDMKAILERGVDIGDARPTQPALVQLKEACKMELTITEGRFHQVKRMLKAVGNEVIYLKRLSMGTLCLDRKLAPGEYRRLTHDEVEILRKG
ncbi:MAG: rRNA pseudouridine synthase [Lachnospiraceae bacterium]|nr:rRNA pseudouridine synthase [Lachnospiraceae bacterium]